MVISPLGGAVVFVQFVIIPDYRDNDVVVKLRNASVYSFYVSRAD